MPRLPDVIYHTKHSCGHSVYWSDPRFGMNVSIWPCPWCGAENGELDLPADALATYDPAENLLCIRQLNDDGTVPQPEGFDEPLSRTIIVQHETGERCCGGRMIH